MHFKAIVDNRTNSKIVNAHYLGRSVLCGVVCSNRKCRWRGWRAVFVKRDLESKHDPQLITDKIKGVKSDKPCPKCNKKRVVFTHSSGRNSY